MADLRESYAVSAVDPTLGWLEMRDLIWGLLASERSRLTRVLREG